MWSYFKNLIFAKIRVHLSVIDYLSVIEYSGVIVYLSIIEYLIGIEYLSVIVYTSVIGYLQLRYVLLLSNSCRPYIRHTLLLSGGF